MAKLLSPAEVEALRIAMLARESSNNYQAINQIGYIGGYQVGASTLETLGYLKKGASKQGNKAVNNPNNWTGKDGIKNVNDFLNSPDVQDKVFEQNVKFNERVLLNKGTIDKTTPTEDVAGFLAASHLLGAGGASKDLTSKDANNVSGLDYFNLGKKAVLSSTPNLNAISPFDINTRADTRLQRQGYTAPAETEQGFLDTLLNFFSPSPSPTQRSDIRQQALSDLNTTPTGQSVSPSSIQQQVANIFGGAAVPAQAAAPMAAPTMAQPTGVDEQTLQNMRAQVANIFGNLTAPTVVPQPSNSVVSQVFGLDLGKTDLPPIGVPTSAAPQDDMQALLEMKGLLTGPTQDYNFDFSGDIGEGINAGISDADMAFLYDMPEFSAPAPVVNTWYNPEEDLGW